MMMHGLTNPKQS